MCVLLQAAPPSLPSPLRLAQVVLPTSLEQDVPEWFFQRTSHELKAAFVEAVRHREQNGVFMTRATRERLQESSTQAAPVYATVKVRFPEGISLQVGGEGGKRGGVPEKGPALSPVQQGLLG